MSVKSQLMAMREQGFPAHVIKTMLEAAKPLGDLSEIREKLSADEYNNVFFPKSRKHGIDGSVPYAYGGSTVPTMLGVSPYETTLTCAKKLRGEETEEEIDEEKEKIFFSGHTVEDSLREFFRYRFGDRYLVFNCEIQWNSRKWPNFVGNMDGMLYDKETDQFGILEIKHTIPRNQGTIQKFEHNIVPENYELQGRAYCECLNADFVIFFLGWGLRPDYTSAVRLDRDKEIGEKIMNECESFIYDYVEKKNDPPVKSASADMIIKEIRKPIDPEAEPVVFEKDRKKVFDRLIEVKKSLDEAIEKEKSAKKMREEAEELYKQTYAPLIEDLGGAQKGVFWDEKRTITVSYRGRKRVNVGKLKEEYPSVYEKVQIDAIDGTALRKEFPDVHKKCSEVNPDSKRTFGIRIQKV